MNQLVNPKSLGEKRGAGLAIVCELVGTYQSLGLYVADVNLQSSLLSTSAPGRRLENVSKGG